MPRIKQGAVERISLTLRLDFDNNKVSADFEIYVKLVKEVRETIN